MTGWHRRAYAFPLGDELRAIWEIMEQLPERFSTQLGWEPKNMMVVVAADPKSAFYLRAKYGENELLAHDGLSILEGHEVLIYDEQRDECEALLRDDCPSEAKWFDLLFVAAQTDEAMQAFHAAYRAVVGHPTAVA